MGNKRALVVDDSRVGRLTMEKKLVALGVGVDQVESGLAALDYLARQRPDMVFMDHMMPDMDGFETTRRIKADPATRGIPVIIISGSDDAEFVREARAAGALDAISKPPAPGVLEALLASLPEMAAVAEAAVPEAAVAASPPAEAPALDAAAVQARVEHILGAAAERLRGELHTALREELRSELRAELRPELETELGQRLEGEFTRERQASRTWEAGQEARLAAQAAHLDELRQRVEQQAPMLERLGQEVNVRMEGHQARAEQGTRELEQRLGRLAEEGARLDAGLAALRTRLEEGEAGRDQRLAALEEKIGAAPGDAGLRAEVERLTARVKALSLALAAGGAVLLAALAVLALRG